MPNRRNIELAERLAAAGHVNLIEFLSGIASGQGDPPPSMDLRIAAADKAAPYLYSKRSPVPAPVYLDPVDLGPCATGQDISDASARVLSEVAAGRMDLNEGERLSNLLENRRKSIETAELERRIVAIENARSS